MIEDILIDVVDFIDSKDITEDEKEAIKEMYNSIYSKNIETKNIVFHVVLLMKIVDTYKEITNVNKKNLIIFVVQKYIQYNINDENEKYMLNNFVLCTLPNMIDTLVMLDNKDIIIKTKNYSKSFCKFFCCS